MKVHELISALKKVADPTATVQFLIAGDDEGYMIEGVAEGIDEDEGFVFLTEDGLNE